MQNPKLSPAQSGSLSLSHSLGASAKTAKTAKNCLWGHVKVVFDQVLMTKDFSVTLLR